MRNVRQQALVACQQWAAHLHAALKCPRCLRARANTPTHLAAALGDPLEAGLGDLWKQPWVTFGSGPG
eukprot:356056-Chlamydomonas_euryale.AAC.2